MSVTHSGRSRQRLAGAALTEREVAGIKTRLQQGHLPRAIADDYGVATESIRRIGRGETWAWVEASEFQTSPLTSILPPEELSPEQQAQIAESAQRLLELQTAIDTPLDIAAIMRERAEKAKAADPPAEEAGQNLVAESSSESALSLDNLCLGLARISGRTTESLKAEILATPQGAERNALVTKIRRAAIKNPPASGRGKPGNSLDASAASAARVEKMLGKLTEETHSDKDIDEKSAG